MRMMKIMKKIKLTQIKNNKLIVSFHQMHKNLNKIKKLCSSIEKKDYLNIIIKLLVSQRLLRVDC
jgi:hypothetical protein